MNLKKPKFWNYRKPNILAYFLLPLSFFLQLLQSLRKRRRKKFKMKVICVGNIYIGGTGKTSLCIKINELLNKKNIKSCFIKKYYTDQIDEQKILQNRGKLFVSNTRVEAINEAELKGYNVAILDDGLQDQSIMHDLSFVCFNTINWIGNGLTIPSGPLRENIKNIKNFKDVFFIGNLENLETITEKIKKINPSVNIHIGEYIPRNINEFSVNEKYIIFSGIGNHDTFVSMVKKNRLNIIKDFEFPDHHNYTNNDINNILEEAKNFNCKILTTEKDYLRLDETFKKFDEIKFIKSDLRILDEKKLIDKLISI